MNSDKIVIVGFGNHITKRIIPAIQKIRKLKIEYAIVRKPKKYSNANIEHNIKFYDFNKKINNNIKWVYISTPIKTHYKIVNKYLDENKNIICEKPLTHSFIKTKKLIDKALAKNLILHEVDMYKHHIQYKNLKKIIKSNYNNITSVKSVFIIPQQNKSDSIYSSTLTGDSVYSVGYYPVSIALSLFGEPKSISYENRKKNIKNISLSNSVKFIYDNFYCCLKWEIGSKYSNEITIKTNQEIFKFNKIFAKDPNYLSTFNIKKLNRNNQIFLGSDDQFVNMIRKFIFKKIRPNYSISKSVSKYLEIIAKNKI